MWIPPTIKGELADLASVNGVTLIEQARCAIRWFIDTPPPPAASAPSESAPRRVPPAVLPPAEEVKEAVGQYQLGSVWQMPALGKEVCGVQGDG